MRDEAAVRTLRHASRSLVASEVYDALRHSITSGALRPGEAISEVKIAERFGVSRTPVREVFHRLASDGFLHIQPQVGTFVAPIRLEAVRDSQFIREALECRAVTLAAERATAADGDALSRMVREQEVLVEAGDLGGFFAADDRLHAELMRIAGRPAVWAVIQDAKAQLDRVRYLSLGDDAWLRGMLAQHAGIVSRVLAQDPRGAEAAMRAHLRTVLAAVERIGRTDASLFEALDGAAEPPPRLRAGS